MSKIKIGQSGTGQVERPAEMLRNPNTLQRKNCDPSSHKLEEAAKPSGVVERDLLIHNELLKVVRDNTDYREEVA